jgi:hypothetical protein
MSDTLKKVKPGDRLVISAATFNTFVDSARDYLQRRHDQGGQATSAGRHNCVLRVRNDSGADRRRYDILGIDSPIFDPTYYPQEFMNAPAVSGVTPLKATHAGRFIVLLEPVAAGELALAVAAGAVPVRLRVPDEDYPYQLAEVTDGSAEELTAAVSGTAAILWRQGGLGQPWALVRLGLPHEPPLFPVVLAVSGGSQGDSQNPATWTYNVIDPLTGHMLATGVNPVLPPNMWRRPSVGYIVPATFGYAHWGEDGGLVLGWINEVAEQEACGIP